MIFMFLMQLIRRWYQAIVFPVLGTPLFYLLFGMWVGLMVMMTYLFLWHSDKARLDSRKRMLMQALMKSAGYGILLSTMLLALVGLCLSYMAESQFFIKYRDILMMLNVLTMPRLTGFKSTMTGLIVLFLLTSQYYALEYVSEISYQLQYPKKWWIYFGLSTCISVLCYIAFVGVY